MTNVSDQMTHWRAQQQPGLTVAPERFRLAPGESRVLTVEADASDAPVGEWQFAQLQIISLTRHVPDVHFPVAIQPALSNLPAAITITAPLASDVVSLDGLKAVEITAAEVSMTGLAPSTTTESALVSDPTSNNPFDGFDPDGWVLIVDCASKVAPGLSGCWALTPTASMMAARNQPDFCSTVIAITRLLRGLGPV